MYKTILLLSGALMMAVVPPQVKAQNFDTSGTASLSGPYLFRYVDFFNDTNGNLTESCSLTGVITFDGKGRYALSNTQLFDSAGAPNGTCASLGIGSYGVQSNGIAQLDNPIFGGTPATLFGTFSQPVVTASSTEDDYFDLLVAVQAPSAAASNNSLSGTFTVGTLDFLNANVSLAREGYFTLTADGNGNISAFTVTGSTAAAGASGSSAYITQNVGASTYAISGTAGGTVTFPGVSTDQTEIVAGSKVLYVSADGNWFVAGSTSGSDMFFGFRAPTGTSSNATLSGTYFTAGMDADLNNSFLDAFYGSINTNGNGELIWHERFDDVVAASVYDYTFNIPVTIGANGSYFDGTFTYLAGANGEALMLIGSGMQFSLNIGVHAPTVTPTSTVWILPTYITNAANYTPITNAFAPGELVNIYGTFGVSTQGAVGLPIPTTLGGVQVLVNGQAAPILSVSSNQISAWIPYEASTALSPVYFATFQVVVNGSNSNTVTVYLDNSSPGIYTAAANGLGGAAILHADYSLVTASSPAKPGETVLLFMNGLGTVTPQVADGAAASGSPLSYADEYNNGYLSILMDDGSGNYPPAGLSGAYLGAFLAPYYAGLYQVNFTLPSALSLANGDVYLALNTLEASNEMATVSLTGFSGASAPVSSKRRPSRLRRPATAAARVSKAKNHRRALPDRPL